MGTATLADIAKSITRLENDQEALFALACMAVKEYQLGMTDENNQIKQVTFEDAEKSLDATLDAIKDNITGE